MIYNTYSKLKSGSPDMSNLRHLRNVFQLRFLFYFLKHITAIVRDYISKSLQYI